MSPERRAQVRGMVGATRTGWRESVRDVVWTLGLADDAGSPSLSRAFCALFALAAVHAALFHEQRIAWPDVAMGFLAVSGYFGLAGLRIFGRAASRSDAGRSGAPPSAGPG